MKKEKILDTEISVGSYQAFINEIFLYVRLKIPAYVCFANVHMLIEGFRDEAFQMLINEANLVAPDGRPLSVFLRIIKGLKQDRVCGMDILPDLLRRAAESGKSVYFYGSTKEVLQAIIKRAKIEFPTLRIAGFYEPAFRKLSEKEDEEITEMIKSATPDLIFVSLGCPKQEKWMAEHKNKFDACLLGLGQAFKVYAGFEKRLPKWMRNLSLEWAYRLCLEPGRLWRRYLYTNSYFLFLVICQMTNQFIKQINERLSKA